MRHGNLNSLFQVALHLPSSTLHPAPCTLHPTPCILHPTPYTRHPTPDTPHPTPHTLHPAYPSVRTLHHSPWTLHTLQTPCVPCAAQAHLPAHDLFLVISLKPRVEKSVSLQYEPASEPLHISVKILHRLVDAFGESDSQLVHTPATRHKY